MAEGRDTPNADAPQAQPASRGVVLLVWGLGVAIMVMVALLILGLSLGWHRKGAPPQPDPTTGRSEPATSPPAAELEIAVPAGSRLAAMSADGAHLAMHMSGPAGDEVIVVDTASNRVISRIRLTGSASNSP